MDFTATMDLTHTDPTHIIARTRLIMHPMRIHITDIDLTIDLTMDTRPILTRTTAIIRHILIGGVGKEESR